MAKTYSSTIGRRQFLKTLGGGAAALALPSSIAERILLRNRSGPNLLVIHTDQQNAWTVSSTPRRPGEPVSVETPHINSLGANGSRLENFFVNSAMCTPSRGCLMTGRYPNSTNTWTNDRPLGSDEITLGQALKEAGYDTGYIGKWHLSGDANPGWGNPDWEEPDLNTYGFDDATYLWNNGHFKTIIEDPNGINPPTISPAIGDENTYPTDFCARKAIEFIRRPRSRPFFLMVGFTDPHQPYHVREPYASLFRPEDMFLPPTLGSLDPEVCRERRAQYCGMVKNIDDRVGDLLAALHDSGQYTNTIVIFTVDHGDYIGEHGMYEKDRMFETVYRVPFLIQWPGQIPAGTVVPQVISTVDIHPTILALLGIAPNPRIQGRNGAHILLNGPGPWEDVAFEYQIDRRFAGLFTPKWHLFVSDQNYHIAGVPTVALYDRLNDPWEMSNRYYSPACADIRADLISRLVAHHLELQSHELEWLWPQYGEPAGIRDARRNPESPPIDRMQVFPNPFLESTAVTCMLCGSAHSSLSVYGVDGRLIRSLHQGPLAGGSHSFYWDGRDTFGRPVGAGTYYCELATPRSRVATMIVRTR